MGTRDPGVGLAGAWAYEMGREVVGEEEEASAECSPGVALTYWGTFRESVSVASVMMTFGR